MLFDLYISMKSETNSIEREVELSLDEESKFNLFISNFASRQTIMLEIS